MRKLLEIGIVLGLFVAIFVIGCGWIGDDPKCGSKSAKCGGPVELSQEEKEQLEAESNAVRLVSEHPETKALIKDVKWAFSVDQERSTNKYFVVTGESKNEDVTKAEQPLAFKVDKKTGAVERLKN